MEITKMLTVSTAHISEDTVTQLDKEVDNDIMGLCLYVKDILYERCGWFIHIPEDLDEVDIPDDLRKCILFAKDLGCEWLCLDRDGEVLKYLDTYEW